MAKWRGESLMGSLYGWLASSDAAVGEKMTELYNYGANRAPSMFAAYQAHTPLNRFDDFMCFDRNRVVLTDGGQSYIHANEVHLPRVQYVLTQAPLAHTIVDFWRMIWRLKANVMVSLMEPTAAERFCPTSEDDVHRCGPLYSIRGNPVSGRSNETWKTVEQTVSTRNSQEVTIRYIQYKKWENDRALPDVKEMLALARDVRSQADEMHLKVKGPKTAKLMKPPPIVAVCPTGAVRCGMLAAADELARSIEEDDVDIPGVARTLRSARYGTIPNMDQYTFLYMLAVEAAKQKGITGAEEALNKLKQVRTKGK